jgi:dipeptidyl aminopeptidase/acylaminoacyl peptidase
MIRAALLPLALTCIVGAAEPPADGEILDRSPFSFDAETAQRLARIEPRIGEILADVSFERITYSSDGLAVRGYIAVPTGVEALPCVIYNRGGNRSFGALNDAEALLALGPIAQAGYVVVASQYRGALGGAGDDEFGGAELNDVLNLIPLLESLPQADPTRIGMVGWSRGGMMTYMALTRTERIAAAVVGAGAADLIESAEHRPEMERVFSELIPHYAEDTQAQLARRSAVYWPDRMHKETPLLLLHGANDWRVDPRQALTLASKLYEANHPFRLVFFEDGDHGLSQHRAEVQDLIRGWLDRYVRPRPPPPTLAADGG